MAELTRRAFVTAGAAAAGLLLCTPTANALDRALRQTANRAVRTTGTTLDQAASGSATGYSRLSAGPGWPLVVRSELTDAKPSRDERRTALGAFVQFTDLHIADTESPARFEYLHPYKATAYRPQEALGTVATSALVDRVNSLRAGPFTGRQFDFVISTGDNTDNHELIELDWFLTTLNGGEITPTTGDPARYEGVQASGSPTFWNPGTQLTDDYTKKGFPQIPGLLDAAIAPFTAPGLNLPWYCTFGNHEDSVVGTLPEGIPGIEGWYTGKHKVIGKPDSVAHKLGTAIKNGKTVPLGELFSGGIVREVTPDPLRRPFSTAEFATALLDPKNTGPGPVGHGFTDANSDGRTLYYTFRIAPGVTGISLDTTTQGGFADGAIGLEQFNWVEATLKRSSSTYFDFFGREVTQFVTDELFIVFSHHTSDTMGNLLPDARRLLDLRLKGDRFVGLLKRFPNVVAWVNGHTHYNKITPHVGKTPTRSFWEINTASHIDFPQHARVIELADNHDGTLSLFTTLIEADAPYSVDYSAKTPEAIASMYREFAYNDIHAQLSFVGVAGDRNTELLVANPLG
ncbi:TIGR03767 family metallophosphoesterase [Amycolatopsis sp. SID8362]|uniref:TIGR03767 family metallophosphoesterase n=1 Tax=Amycolatopsis sp. SID8362 TaxID=2690346 RepID=UPI001367DF82|nr:TIGR03767 family metallophosphoesterase [Amycolatopsis sp. SID8362]NBH11804.1 TIGR03767 family metallophosphoesterase [Amycolatopsis sp. SID8362]NED48496.1 TIGR03767 family metallophosphoesterase [Amycolatopsis sp. SID8362]